MKNTAECKETDTIENRYYNFTTRSFRKNNREDEAGKERERDRSDKNQRQEGDK